MMSKQLPLLRVTEGSAAVEFALVVPCLIVLVLGGLAYGIASATVHAAQQLAAEAARASVAGLSASERATLARNFTIDSIGSYPFLDPSKVSLVVTEGSAPDYAFSVAVTVDLRGSFIYELDGILPMPAPSITRTAVIRRGGF